MDVEAGMISINSDPFEITRAVVLLKASVRKMKQDLV
jgi:hypothetical protein